jgi:hypothetical protein
LKNTGFIGDLDWQKFKLFRGYKKLLFANNQKKNCKKLQKKIQPKKHEGFTQ